MDGIAELRNNYLPTPSSKVTDGGPRRSVRQSIRARKLTLTKPSSGDVEITSDNVDDTNQKRSGLVLGRKPQKTSDPIAESVKSTDHVYMCPECDRKFTDARKLKNHRRVGHKLHTEQLLKTPSPVQPEEVPPPPLVAIEEDEHSPPSLPGSSRSGNPMPEMVRRLLEDCEKYPAGPEMEELGSLTTTPPPSFESSTTPSSSPNGSKSVGNEIVPEEPPVTIGNQQRRVQFQCPAPRRTILEDKAARGVPSMGPPPPTPVGISTVCPICDLILPNMGAYKNHLEIHEGKRPFMCPECYRGYETGIQLLEHWSVHSKQPIFACGGCGKKYKTSRGLHNHRILKTCGTPAPGQ